MSPSLATHALPYVLFVAVGYAAAELPPELARWGDPAQALLAGVALIVFARRGAYRELATRGTGARGAAGLAVLAGLVCGAAWVPLAELVPSLGTRGGFDAENATWAHWGGRLLGSLAVVPFAEELFVRSLVPRFVDAGEGEWYEHPVGRLSPLAFAVSLGFFTISHPEWLAALVTGAVWTLLLMHTRRLRDLVLAHAVANAVLAGWVVTTGEYGWW